MAFSNSTIDIKKADQDTFVEWLEEEINDSVFCEDEKAWDFCVDIEGGYGGYFWESLALKMVIAFDGIIFRGNNNFGWDDHYICTEFTCDGKEITLERSLGTPEPDEDDFEDEDEYAEAMEELADMRADWEAENDIPYSAKFSVEEVLLFAKIYEEAKGKLEEADFVESLCAEHNIPSEKFIQFATILDFEKRLGEVTFDFEDWDDEEY